MSAAKSSATRRIVSAPRLIPRLAAILVSVSAAACLGGTPDSSDVAPTASKGFCEEERAKPQPPAVFRCSDWDSAGDTAQGQWIIAKGNVSVATTDTVSAGRTSGTHVLRCDTGEGTGFLQAQISDLLPLASVQEFSLSFSFRVVTRGDAGRDLTIAQVIAASGDAKKDAVYLVVAFVGGTDLQLVTVKAGVDTMSVSNPTVLWTAPSATTGWIQFDLRFVQGQSFTTIGASVNGEQVVSGKLPDPLFGEAIDFEIGPLVDPSPTLPGAAVVEYDNVVVRSR